MTKIGSAMDCVIGHYAGANFTLLIYAPDADRPFYAEAKDGDHTSASALPGTKADTERHVIVIDAPNRCADMYSADGTKESHLDFPTSWTMNEPESNFPLLLFGSSKSAAGDRRQCVSAKIYGVKIWETENGVESLVHSYVPAKNGDHVGFYDTETGDFFSQFPSTAAAFAYGGDLLDIDGATCPAPYIENDGSDYSCVDTRYFPNARTKVEIDFQQLELPTDSSYGDIPFGHYSTEDYSLLIYGPKASPTYKLVAKDLGYAGLDLAPTVPIDYRRHTAIIDIPGRRAEMRDATGRLQGSADFTTKNWTFKFDKVIYPLEIFGSSDKNPYWATRQRIKGRIYGVRIYENENDDGSGEWKAIRNFVPCTCGGLPGFKDKVSGEFFSGANIKAGGTLTEEEENAPYLDTTASTKTISFDTGYYVSSNTCIVCDYRPLRRDVQQFVFAAGSENTDGKMYMRIYGNSKWGYSYVCGEDTYIPFDNDYYKYEENVRRQFVLDAFNSKVRMESEGETIYEADLPEKARTPLKSSSTLKIFSHEGGGGNYCSGRLFSFKIYEEGVLVRDYRPAAKGGRLGLMDVVGDGGFIMSANAGAMRCQGVVDEEPGNGDAYVENDGITALDLGYLANMSTRIEFDFGWTFFPAYSTLVCGAWTTGTLRYALWENRNTDHDVRFVFNGNSTSGNQTALGILADTGRHTAIIDMKNKTLSYVTGGVTNTVKPNASAAFGANDASVDGMGVFDGIDNGFAQGMTSFARVYAVRIYENDTDLKHEFLPYTDGETTSLRDTVTGYVATKTAAKKLNVENPDWPVIGGRGTDGAERWFEKPESFLLSKTRGTKTVVASAVGAIGYRWTKDGEPLEDGPSVTAEWNRKGVPAVYTVTPVYRVLGAEVLGEEVEFTAQSIPTGTVVIVR